MSGKDLRQRFMRRLAGMRKYSRLYAWLVVASYVAQVFAAIAVGHWMLTQQPSVLLFIGMFLLILFIGTRFRGFNNIVHECTHATFSEVRDDNRIIGSICAALNLASFKDYRDEHLSHHAHLGDYEKDMDLHDIEALGLHEPLTRRTIFRHIMTPLTGRHLPYYLSANMGARDGRLYQLLKAALLALTVAGLLTEPLTTLLFVVIPFVFVFTALNYWTDCVDHAGIVQLSDELDASRNVLAPYLVRLLFFPRNDCFHLVHHLFPNVPAQHLEMTHNLLLEDPEYQRKQRITREVGLKLPTFLRRKRSEASVR